MSSKVKIYETKSIGVEERGQNGRMHTNSKKKSEGATKSPCLWCTEDGGACSLQVPFDIPFSRAIIAFTTLVSAGTKGKITAGVVSTRANAIRSTRVASKARRDGDKKPSRAMVTERCLTVHEPT